MTAVFRCVALQRPARAARLRGCMGAPGEGDLLGTLQGSQRGVPAPRVGARHPRRGLPLGLQELTAPRGGGPPLSGRTGRRLGPPRPPGARPPPAAVEGTGHGAGLRHHIHPAWMMRVGSDRFIVRPALHVPTTSQREPTDGASTTCIAFFPEREISTHQGDGTVVRRRAGPRPRGWAPRPEETVVTSCVLSVSERDRLVRLLALVPPPHRWAFEHRHAPLLCAIGILDPPDEGYARAARRRFADPSETRERVLALLVELDRETRTAPNAYRRACKASTVAVTRPRRPGEIGGAPYRGRPTISSVGLSGPGLPWPGAAGGFVCHGAAWPGVAVGRGTRRGRRSRRRWRSWRSPRSCRRRSGRSRAAGRR